MKKENPFCIDGVWLRDKEGRVRILHGCNISGLTKTPAVFMGEASCAQSLSSAEISFVGYPFPEEEADEHFARLTSWGFTFLRWVITWEAVEHAGPELYDEDYLAYVRRLLKKCEEYEITVFIDPYQDAWSRFTGGEGAPAWTLESVGFDISKLSVTGSALEQQAEDCPQTTGLINHDYYAYATMSTLFFAGDTLAPHLQIEGEGIQTYLQNHFINAMVHTARRLKDCKAIVGFGVFNEPNGGYIGNTNLSHLNLISKEVNTLFREGFECPWKKAGVWTETDGKAEILKPDYFSVVDGRKIHFAQDFLKPFLKTYIASFQKKHSHYLFFVDGKSNAALSLWSKETDDEFSKIVDAFQWHGGNSLILTQRQSVFSDNRENVGTANSGTEDKSLHNEYVFSRPYALAIAGIPLQMKFNADKQNPVFEFEWEATEGTTEIFVPQIWFPNGWTIHINSSCEVIANCSGNYAYISGVIGKCKATVLSM